MARGSNQKLKLMYIAQYLNEYTDEQHGLTMEQILNLLEKDNITAERKSIYADLEELRDFGMDITSQHEGRTTTYSLVSRDFELAELKLLVDSVQAARFITEKKSRELIKKLESLTSTYQAKQLHRQVIISGRVKAGNESVFYSVDRIHTAIQEGKKVSFHYFQWNRSKKTELRRGGKLYSISPWALVWDNEYYYLIGYDSEDSKMKHYRVDKMQKLEISLQPREGRDLFESMDLAKYSNSLFGMYGGDETAVTMHCENSLAGPIIDRFGTDIPITPLDETHFSVRVNVSVSPQFIGWVIGLGSGAVITAPESVVQQMRREAIRLRQQYLE